MPVTATLISHTPEPEKLVAAAGKLCYSNASATKLLDGLDAEKTAYFVDMLSSQGHMSTLEHASFTFAIEGVSRSLLAQITRHRIASFSVQSQRYVPLKNFGHVIPQEIEDDAEAKAEYMAAMEFAENSYNKITEILQAKGKTKKQAIENARAVLPGACETKMMLTMNARSLHNFFALRCCMRAQAEIRTLADLMLAEVKAAAPLLFAKAGPPCIKAGCPEGALSCAKMAEMREKYAAR